MKVLVTGAAGQLGYDVIKELTRRGIEHAGVDMADFDITDEAAVLNYLKRYRPDCVIHCAAYTAVDKAEDEPDLCHRANAVGTENIAKTCREIGAKMIYLSTDYVFPGQGQTPYETNSSTGPQNVYGKTKLAGERAVQDLLEKYFVVRISWVFGKNGGNFVKTMLRLGGERDTITVVSDQIGAPTYTADLAPLLCDMAESEKYGVYHATNEGDCSWAAFAGEIMRQASLPAQVVPISSADYPAKAKRPANSRLSKKSLDEAGFSRLPGWQDALGRYIKEQKD